MASKPVNGYVDPNFANPMGSDDAMIIIYGYRPSLALGALAVALFTLACVGHAFLLFNKRTWYFTPFVVGTAMEIVGNIMRILSSQVDPYRVSFFIVQYFFIVVAPVFFSAAIYTIITVMIDQVGREYAPAPPKLILGLFIASDVVATIIQITGAALVGVAYSNQKDPNTPNNILLAGLAFQVFSFALFCLCLVMFLWKSRHALHPRRWKAFSAGVCLATAMVYIRTCVRLAETAQGLQHYLSTHEVIYGCLEFAPIVIAVYLFLYWHPGQWLGPGTKMVKQENSASGVAA